MGPRVPAKRSASLTCILPGLVWPTPDGTRLPDLPALPALSALLGRARSSVCPSRSAADWFTAQCGLAVLPWGRLRLAGENLPGTETDAEILCADPVGIGFARDTLLVQGPQSLALTQEEADSLCATLNREFGALGVFRCAAPQRWYLESRQAPAFFAPLEDVVGRPAAYFTPEGEHAATWNRVTNEIQTVLFADPVNQARQAAGKPMANAVWFWGEARSGVKPPRLPVSRIVSSDEAIRGLAMSTGIATATPQTELLPQGGGRMLWHEAALHEAALVGDFDTWQRELERLERTLLAPAWEAWRSGRLETLSVVTPGDRGGLELRLPASLRWAFWRRPLDATLLATRLSKPAQDKDGNDNSRN